MRHPHLDIVVNCANLFYNHIMLDKVVVQTQLYFNHVFRGNKVHPLLRDHDLAMSSMTICINIHKIIDSHIPA